MGVSGEGWKGRDDAAVLYTISATLRIRKRSMRVPIDIASKTPTGRRRLVRGRAKLG
jgi:hypothetical protein